MANEGVAPRARGRGLERIADLFGGSAVRVLASLLCGALLALTLPPVDFLPAIAAYSGLVGLAAIGDARARRPIRHRLVLGAAFGFGYHVAGLWWIGEAFLVDADTFGALLPLAVVGLPLLLAPFHAFAVALAGLAPPGLASRTVALAMTIALCEWLRGVVFTGFPWNVPAVQLSSSLALAQGVSVVGIVGLAPLAVLIGALPALLVGRRLALSAGVVLMTGALFAFGVQRLATPAASDEGLRVRIVQPAVPQREKWAPEHRARIWSTLLELTEAPSRDGPRPDVVVWPETALPFLYRTPSVEQYDLVRALGPGRTLITGAVEIEREGGVERATNSVFVIDDQGEIVDRYDKAHLVPFGEYLPFRGLLSRIGLSAIAARSSQFDAGSPRATLDIPGLPPARPLICYEAIFGGSARSPDVAWILNVTNDAWFGDTPGPYQHIRHVALRGIEQGLPTIRSANTGISGAIDPYGRFGDVIPLNRLDFRDVSLNHSTLTVYNRVGNGPFTFVTALFLVWVVWGRWVTRGANRQRG